jgi:hypothetical protein
LALAHGMGVQELIARIWVDQNDIGCNLDSIVALR